MLVNAVGKAPGVFPFSGHFSGACTVPLAGVASVQSILSAPVYRKCSAWGKAKSCFNVLSCLKDIKTTSSIYENSNVANRDLSFILYCYILQPT